MLSRWQHDWRFKVIKATRWCFCLSLIICFSQAVNLKQSKLLSLSSFKQSQPVLMAQTLSEDQLFKKLIERAASAYKKERFKEAIQYFERAMVLNLNPNIYWNLAVCYYKLANYPKALANANAYLKKGSPNKKMRRKVEAKKKDILYHLQKAYLSPKARPQRPFSRNDQKSNRPNPQESPRSIGLGPLDVFEMRPEDKTPNHSRLVPNQTRGDSYLNGNDQVSHLSRHNLVVWGSMAGVLLAGSIGLHLYGDHIWDNRPSGGGSLAQDARREALLVSWVGDGMLALSITSLIVGLISYTNHVDEAQINPNTQTDASHEFSGISHISFTILQSQNTRQPRANGGLLGWRFIF